MVYCFGKRVCFSKGILLFILFFLLVASKSYAARVTLAWDPVNQPSILGGYKVYYGSASRSYQYSKDAGLNTTYTVDDSNLTAGKTYYFAVTAYDKNKQESGYSNEVSWTVPSTSTVNSSPVANSDSATTYKNKAISINVLANDSDPEGDTLSISSVGAPSHGTTQVSGGSVLYTPSKDFSGTDAFTYKVTDNRGGTATGTVSLNVLNQVPVAKDLSLSTTQGVAVTGSLSASDADGDPLVYSVVNGVSSGTLSMNASTGAFVYTPGTAAGVTVSFTYKANDGSSDSNVATVKIVIASKSVDPVATSLPVIESGSLQVDHNWKRVSFKKVFTIPAVVAKPAGFNDPAPCVVRIRNVDSTGFEMRIQEWNYLDGIHGQETVDFIAVEQGSYSLPDGTLLEAGSFQTSATGTAFAGFNFSQPFNVTPVLLATVVSYNDADAVTTRLRNITEAGFQFVMQEQENRNRSHPLESACYIAWEPSSVLLDGVAYQVFRAGSKVGSSWHPIIYPKPFDGAPRCIVDFQTADDLDTVSMRYNFKDFAQIELKAEEETSYDAELDHLDEVAGFIGIHEVAKTEGLVAAYNFDEGSGAVLYDRSGNGNHGYFYGALWNSVGKYGGALSFDGYNDWVTIMDSNSLDLSTGMTLEAWVYPRDLSGYDSVIIKEGANGHSYGMFANIGWSNVPGVFVNTGVSTSCYSLSKLPAGGWTHLAGTYDGKTLKMFVNGVQVKSLGVTGPVVPSSNPLRIGGNSLSGSYFYGLIDEVRIYNRALSQSEIASDMKRPVGSSN